MAYPFITKSTNHGFFQAMDQVSASGTSAFQAAYVTGHRSTLKWVDTFNGVRNPYWRSYLRNGGLATTSMSGTKSTVESTTGFLEVSGWNLASKTESSKRRNGFVGVIYRPPSIPSAVVSPPGRADEDAAGALISAYARVLTGLQAQVATGESAEARRMIANRGSRFLNGVLSAAKALRRIASPARELGRLARYSRLGGRRNVNVKKIGKNLADSYLESVYGWIPLVNDIRSAYDVLNEYRPPFEYVQGRNADNPGIISSSSGSPGFGALEYDTEYRRVDRYSVNYACMARLYHGNIVPTSDLVRNAGFSLREFPITVYNLLPWSFLLDYFVNINEMITGVLYYDDLPGTYAKCVIHETKQTWWAGNARPNGTVLAVVNDIISQPSTVIVTTRTIARSTHQAGLPLPRLRFRIPSLRQGLNIAALVASKALG